MPLEPIATPLPGPRAFFRDVTRAHFANAVIGVFFAASGPLAIVLAIGAKGGLGEADLASWFFASFFINGLITIAFSLLYRQPLTFFWTIPGTVLLGPALAHLSHGEVVGAFILSGLLMLALGCSGLVRRVMSAVPMPIVMGMVAGAFLQFGLEWVHAFERDALIAVPMTAVFLLALRFPQVSARFPPLILALITGILAAMLSGRFSPVMDPAHMLAAPMLYAPELTWRAALELVVPLAITVLVVQNGQGNAVLTAAGHDPPVNSIAAVCGIGAAVTGAFGAAPTCLTGPVNALITANDDTKGQYTAGVMVGVLALGFGLFSPLLTRLMLAAPPAFIATLAGLGMLRVLQSAFTTAFKDRFPVGALVTFLVTVSGISILNIGAPFWGLVFGTLVSWLVEREHFAAQQK